MFYRFNNQLIFQQLKFTGEKTTLTEIVLIYQITKMSKFHIETTILFYFIFKNLSMICFHVEPPILSFYFSNKIKKNRLNLYLQLIFFLLK